MAWPKGVPRPKKVKPLEIVGVEMPIVESDETTVVLGDAIVMPNGDKHILTEEYTSPGEIAAQDTWRYHDTLEPRVFKAGEVIPSEWTSDHSKWRRNQMGQWEKAA